MDDAWQAKGDVGLATRNIDKLKAKDEVPNAEPEDHSS
jgi:hypothetical protein